MEEYGADINYEHIQKLYLSMASKSSNQYVSTPLIIAIKNAHDGIVSYLVEKNVNVEYRDTDGFVSLRRQSIQLFKDGRF